MKARPQIPGAHWATVGLGVTLAWASCVVGPILYAHSPSTSSSWQLAPAGLLALYLLKLWLERKRADTFSLLLFRSDGLTSPLLRGLFYPLLIGGASVLLYQSALPSISHLHSIELSSQHPAFIQLRVSDLPANDTLSLRSVSSPLSIAGEFLAPFLACVLWPLIVSKLAWAVLQQYRSFLRDTETMRVARYIDVLYLDQPGSTSCRDFANTVAVPDGYVKCVLPIEDYDPVNMLRKATILLVVVDPQRFQDNRLLRWLRVERLQRDKEAIEKGPTANIVYTKEGDRRRAFLTVKFGVIPQSSSSTTTSTTSTSTTSTSTSSTSTTSQQQEKEQTPHPAYTLPVLLHTYLTEFGAMPLNALDLSEGVPKSTVEDVWSRLDESADRESAEPHLSLKLFWEYLRSCQTCGVHTGICRSRERVHHLTPTLGTWLRAYCNPAVRSRLWEFHAALWNPLNYTVVSGLVALLLLYVVYWPFATDDEGESVSLAAAWFLWTAAVLLGNRLLEVARQTPPVVHNKGHFEEAVAKEQQGKLYSPPPDSLRLADLKVSFDLPAITDQSEARQLVEQAPQQLAVSKLFCFSAQGFALPESSHYSAAEHLKSSVQTEPTILVRDQDILVEYFFTLSASDLANGRALLTSLQPGQSLSKLDALKLCPDQRLLASLLSAGVLGPERPVAVKRWNMKELRASFNSDGYVLLPKFLPPHAFSQFQQYYRSVMEGYGGRSAADAYNLHFYFWNDEPLGRYYNHQLTQFFQKLLKRPLLHPGLAMGIWIMPGEGCPLHQDTSPPFDLTWDICIDHAGSCPRPLTFLFPSGPKEINLHPNDSILFNGGVLPHVCGSLSSSPVNMHNVFLATWTYA